MLIQLITISIAIYLRPCYCGPKGMHLVRYNNIIPFFLNCITIYLQEDPEILKQLHDDFFDTDVPSIIRYCFEVIVIIQAFIYLFVQQLEEIINQGFPSFIKGLVSERNNNILLLWRIIEQCIVLTVFFASESCLCRRQFSGIDVHSMSLNLLFFAQFGPTISSDRRRTYGLRCCRILVYDAIFRWVSKE